MRGSSGKTQVGLLLIILSLVVVVLGLTWFTLGREEKNPVPATVSESSESLSVSATVTPADSLRTERYRTTLTDPSGKEVLGELAKKTQIADDRSFIITVRLPEVSDDSRYGAWLVQSAGAEKKYLGRLDKSGNDFVLEYSLDEVEEQFDKIIVVGGPQPDQLTENIMAEGVIGSQLLL